MSNEWKALSQEGFRLMDKILADFTLLIIPGIVLSLLFAAVYLVKKYPGKKKELAGQEERIRVVTSTFLGPKKSIALVEVAGEKIVVGITATHITMLTKVGSDKYFEEVLKGQSKPEATNESVELYDELWEKV